ncbi:uncharacterized protein AC631_01125 [Debaryomyces fabryi]|uniref:Uncharacterized protein n=1 Tax=Debaryomyces fabryi TaxID=58627 RepID=A0A0V1Q3M8_9ASCO|nr:uncharacterized protein AC631_01125 [Debaryomyces fabryi]KSA03112.1 hypothetical protein AC631_01125 [Debaryomyces fabryi]CUM45990.1 unnamed protein product [Debaryomyces fabryi]
MNGHNEGVPSSNEERFSRFLEYRGIKRVPKSTDQHDEEAQSPREAPSYSLFSSSDDESAIEANINAENHNLGIFDVDNIDIDMNDERVIDYFGLSRLEENPDADEFYTERRESFTSDNFNEVDLGIDESNEASTCIDKEIQYVAFNKFGDRRYGNNSKDRIRYEPIESENINNKFPLNSQIAYVNWEAHDSITRKEIATSRGFGNNNVHSDDDNNMNDNDNDNDNDNENTTTTDSTDSTNTNTNNNNNNNNNENSEEKHNIQNTFKAVSKDKDFDKKRTLDKNEEYYGMQDSSCKTNGGIYNPLRSEFTAIEDSDPTRLVILPPAQKYRDLIELEALGVKKLMSLDNVRKYKNNISTIISDSYGNDFLVTCANSDIVIFDFDSISQLPNHYPVLRFDTKPTFTSTTDRLISTWPYFPHTINFLKTDTWLGKPVLSACLDDGTLMIWYVETITAQIVKFGLTKNSKVSNMDPDDAYTNQNRFYGIKIKPDFKLKMEASLWGLDFLSYGDDTESTHNLIVASDNSQSIVLFYYHEQDERFYHIKSHQVLHNIPEVSFLSSEIQNDVHTIKVTCASISGELIIFKFNFKLNNGPLDKDEYEYFRKEAIYYVDATMAQIESRRDNRLPEEDLRETELKMKRFHRVVFNSPTVITRVLLGEDCWTCKPISSNAFKHVQSIRAMTGDHRINEEQEIEHIMNESEILDFQYDPLKTSHFGLSARWQFFESLVLTLTTKLSENQDSTLESAKLTGVDDDYRRIHKGIESFVSNIQQKHIAKKKSLNGKSYWPLDTSATNMLAVSTSKKLGLFRADTLFCNSATKKVFDLSIPFSDESKFSNRISITHIIPALLCFISVTQQGLISIMRLCQHRGLYGMRQEHIFPNALSLALGSRGYRTIAGLAIRDMSFPTLPRYFIYVTYTDGIIVAYKLSVNSLQDLVLQV